MKNTTRLAAQIEVLDTHLLTARHLLLQNEPALGSDFDRAASRLTVALQCLEQMKREMAA